MRYENIEKAMREHAIPLEDWVERSGKTVLSGPVGTVKRCCWHGEHDTVTLKPGIQRLTYWAAHTDKGLKFGAAHTRLAATRHAGKAIRMDRLTAQSTGHRNG